MEQKIRELAYKLWEQAGKPEGRDIEFWDTALQELYPVQYLLREKHRWTKKAFARDAVGNEVPLTHSDAVSFCMRGAIDRVCLVKRTGWQMKLKLVVAVRNIRPDLAVHTTNPFLTAANDYCLTYEEVIQAVKDAEI